MSVPPVKKQLIVNASQARCFSVFTDGIDRWWPREHHIGASPLERMIVEPRAGGRWYEIANDGREQPWGKVVAYDAPERLHLIWSLNGQWTYDPEFETNVEVTFAEDGDHTIVTFEHRDLDRYGDNAEEIRGNYDTGMDGGWRALLDGFQRAAEEA